MISRQGQTKPLRRLEVGPDLFEEFLERITAIADDERRGRVPRAHAAGTFVRDTPEGRFRIAATLTALELANQTNAHTASRPTQ